MKYLRKIKPNLVELQIEPIAGSIDKPARNNDPGKVILDNTESNLSAVSFPGLIPGIKPPLFFKSSAILFVGIVMAV